MNSKNRPTVIFYHVDEDGYLSAALAKNGLKKKGFTDLTLVPVQYGCLSVHPVADGGYVLRNDHPGPIDEITFQDKNIYFLDFYVDKDILEALLESAYHVYVLDHHKSSEYLEEMRSTPGLTVIRNMNKAGCALSHEFFTPNDHSTIQFVDYVEDRDLWLWKMPKSKEVNMGISMIGGDIDVWVDILDEMNYEGQSFSIINRMREKGSVLLHYQEKLIQDIISRTRREVTQDFFGPTLKDEGFEFTCTHVQSSILQSEIADKLNEENPEGFSAVSYVSKVGNREEMRISFRSRNGVGMDVGKIAKVLGGGGHKHASGALVIF